MYDRVADLDLHVEAVRHRQQESETTGGFTRVSTTVELWGPDGDGGRCVGAGEDVSYDAPDQERFASLLATLPLAGTYTLRSFADHLDGLDLFPEPPERPAARHYRRWALESAALDLALRQADLSLGEALDRAYEPVRFVVSPRLGGDEAGGDEDGGGDASGDDGPSAGPVRALRAMHPDVGVKLDATADWDDALVADLAATGAVEVIDFKGHYEDAAVATAPDPALYRRVREAFPEAILEDPKLTPATRDALAGAEARLAWDAPITGVEDIAALSVEPRWLNCKPSRFGTVEALLEFIAGCERAGIRLYGGGQFELDVGRDQIQALASLCYPDGPNDVAPGAYNESAHTATPPGSPLPAPPATPGFGYDDGSS